MLVPVLHIIKPLFCFFKMKDRIFMLCSFVDLFRKADCSVSMVVTTQKCMQGISVQDVWLFLPLLLKKQTVVCVR